MADPTRIVKATHPIKAQLAKVDADVLRQMASDLEAAYHATLNRLMHATEDWDIHQAQGVLAELRRQMLTFDTNGVTALGAAMAKAHGLGIDQMLAAVSAGHGITVSTAPLISTQALKVSQETIPALITDVSAETITRVSRILRASVLGQTGPFGAMKQISGFIPTGNYGEGPFGSAMLRAETIERTETSRILNSANYDTLRDLAQSDSGYGKEWSATMDDATRETHADADGQQVGVDEPFHVGDDELDFPGDPGGSPEETINCRCSVIPCNTSWPADQGGWDGGGSGDEGGGEGEG